MPSNQKIPILNRTLRVLEALTQRGQASAKQLSMDLEIPPATCYRILNTLADANWLLRDSAGDYRLSFGISRLGGLASDMARFFAVSNQPVSDLAAAMECSIKISIREGNDWLILARQQHAKSRIALNQVGIRDRIVVGSAGAVLLREVPEDEILQILKAHSRLPENQHPETLLRIQLCREKGFATDLGKTNPAIHAVSVPLCLRPLEENAALTAVFSAGDTPESNLESVVYALRQTAGAIEKTFTGK